MKTATTDQTISTYAVVEAARIRFTAATADKNWEAQIAIKGMLKDLIGAEMTDFHCDAWYYGMMEGKW